MSERKTIDLEQGWEFMQKGITKLKNILEGLPEPQFSSEDYMMLYTYWFPCHFAFSCFIYFLLIVCVSKFWVWRKWLWYCLFCFIYLFFLMYRTIYNMCTQKPPHDYSQQLYDKYRESFEEYITSTVRNILCVLWLHVFFCILFELAWLCWCSMKYELCVIQLLAVEYHFARYRIESNGYITGNVGWIV